jgi:hypothetical protein
LWYIGHENIVDIVDSGEMDDGEGGIIYDLMMGAAARQTTRERNRFSSSSSALARCRQAAGAFTAGNSVRGIRELVGSDVARGRRDNPTAAPPTVPPLTAPAKRRPHASRSKAAPPDDDMQLLKPSR